MIKENHIVRRASAVISQHPLKTENQKLKMKCSFVSQQLTIPNLLSLLRILLLIPISILLLKNEPEQIWIIFTLILIAACTDFFDGLLARKLNQVSDFGKILDPVADKISIGVVAIILMIQNKISLLFLLAIICRDVLILVGGLIIKEKKGIVLQSNKYGKWTALIITAYLIVAFLNLNVLEFLRSLLLVVSIILIIISLVSYTLRFLKTLN